MIVSFQPSCGIGANHCRERLGQFKPCCHTTGTYSLHKLHVQTQGSTTKSEGKIFKETKGGGNVIKGLQAGTNRQGQVQDEGNPITEIVRSIEGRMMEISQKKYETKRKFCRNENIQATLTYH